MRFRVVKILLLSVVLFSCVKFFPVWFPDCPAGNSNKSPLAICAFTSTPLSPSQCYSNMSLNITSNILPPMPSLLYPIPRSCRDIRFRLYRTRYWSFSVSKPPHFVRNLYPHIVLLFALADPFSSLYIYTDIEFQFLSPIGLLIYVFSLVCCACYLGCPGCSLHVFQWAFLNARMFIFNLSCFAFLLAFYLGFSSRLLFGKVFNF